MTAMIMASWPILALCLFIAPTSSQSNGMDMSMDMPMNLAAGNMLPYLHFTPGDTVWFLGWVPSSAGATVGTCIGLFLLSILERWLAACLGLAEQHWTGRACVMMIKGSNDTAPSCGPSTTSSSSSWLLFKKFSWLRAPFVPEADITRGVVYAAQRSLQILLMLTVMTFQLAFILSIVIGSGVGETLFGRFLSFQDH